MKAAASESYSTLFKILFPARKSFGYSDVEPYTMVLSIVETVIFAAIATPHKSNKLDYYLRFLD
jgi:hypothetical protein